MRQYRTGAQMTLDDFYQAEVATARLAFAQRCNARFLAQPAQTQPLADLGTRMRILRLEAEIQLGMEERRQMMERIQRDLELL